MNNFADNPFSPIGLEAVLQRIANACGLDLNAHTEVIDQKGTVLSKFQKLMVPS